MTTETNDLNARLLDVVDAAYPNPRAYEAAVAETRKAAGDLLAAHSAYLKAQQVREYEIASQLVNATADLIADMEQIADALENGEPLAPEMEDRYADLASLTGQAASKLSIRASALDTLHEQMQHPWDSLVRLYRRFPALGARGVPF